MRSALAYATSRGARLPTEAEWCAVAQGRKRRLYPWGDEYLPGRCNDREAGIKGTQPVGSYEEGRGPYGHYDLAGNVSEWVLTYESGKNADPSGLDDANAAVRGGSFRQDKHGVLNSWFWLRRALHETDVDLGFRLAIDGK
jgi:formylglycine-generating enzyme required for sulfatase activity